MAAACIHPFADVNNRAEIGETAREGGNCKVGACSGVPSGVSGTDWTTRVIRFGHAASMGANASCVSR